MSEVVALTIEQIMPLRLAVLRVGTPVKTCNFPEDNFADVVHFGIVRDGEVVATSTWIQKECPFAEGTPALQLKGMATATSMQGQGLGVKLIERGIEHARSRRMNVVWANARDSAMGFYERCGFISVGDGFIESATNMPHHVVMKEI